MDGTGGGFQVGLVPGTGGAGGGFKVDFGLLAEAAEGIDGVISQLSDLGIAETGEDGRGFALLDLDTEGLGVPSLMSAFSGFTGRWSWGVRTLVQDGNQFAQRLGLNAGVYADTDRYVTGVIKVAVNSALGDPYLPDSQVENESFGQIFSAWKPSTTLLSPQERQQMDQTNAGEVSSVIDEVKDVVGGPWWLRKRLG